MAPVQVVNPGVQDLPLVQRRPQGAVQTVLEVELPFPLDDMGEQVAVERGVLRQKRPQIEHRLRRDQLVEANLARRYPSPVTGRHPVLGIGTLLTHRLEDHPTSLSNLARPSSHVRRLPIARPHAGPGQGAPGPRAHRAARFHVKHRPFTPPPTDAGPPPRRQLYTRTFGIVIRFSGSSKRPTWTPTTPGTASMAEASSAMGPLPSTCRTTETV